MTLEHHVSLLEWGFIGVLLQPIKSEFKIVTTESRFIHFTNLWKTMWFSLKTWHKEKNVIFPCVFSFCFFFPHSNVTVCMVPCSIASISLFHASPHDCFSPHGRLELQHGFCLPVPQLEGVRGCVRAAMCLCSGGAHFYAWEPSLLPGGKRHTDAGTHTSCTALPFSLLMMAMMTFTEITAQKNNFWLWCWGFCVFWVTRRNLLHVSALS